MGQTFTTLHVQTADLHLVRSVLGRMLAQQGFVPVEDTTLAERAIHISQNGRWLTLEDEDFSWYDDDAFELLQAFALQLQVPSVRLMVYDGEFAQLDTIFADGRHAKFSLPDDCADTGGPCVDASFLQELATSAGNAAMLAAPSPVTTPEETLLRIAESIGIVEGGTQAVCTLFLAYGKTDMSRASRSEVGQPLGEDVRTVH